MSEDSYLGYLQQQARAELGSYALMSFGGTTLWTHETQEAPLFQREEIIEENEGLVMLLN